MELAKTQRRLPVFRQTSGKPLLRSKARQRDADLNGGQKPAGILGELEDTFGAFVAILRHLRTLLSFNVIIAISEAAKKALIKMRTIRSTMEKAEKDVWAEAVCTLVDSGHKWPYGFRRHKFSPFRQAEPA